MCGIAGFISHLIQADPRSAESVALRMSDQVAARGPDGVGLWSDGRKIALAHRRLSILDLSHEGHQPMACHTGRYVLIFNGEIYNCEELRKELASSGNAPRWRGHSDTEVLLGGFVAWGIRSTLVKCVGMFALAVWDVREHCLTLARDRMGEKPLYYGWQGTGDARAFLFGSDLKALKAHPSFEGVIDRDAISMLLRSNHIPTPKSIYKGISKLEQGHSLVFCTESQQLVNEPYWSLVDDYPTRTGWLGCHTNGEKISVLEQLLKSAVNMQMVADVSVGAFLSGGIDSSLIVALMQSQSYNPVRTFSIGFHESGYDEAVHAKAVARHLGTEHTELYVTPGNVLDVIPQLSNVYSEPFSDPSQIPTLILSRLARQSVTVSLTGDAGDELFGGYDRYRDTHDLWRVMKWVRGTRKKRLVDVARALPETWIQNMGTYPRLSAVLKEVRTGHRFLKFDNRKELYASMTTHWSNTKDVVIGAKVEGGTADAIEDRLSRFPDMEYMMMTDLMSYLPDDILVKVDRAGMGVGLETRMPFLDHRVVEYALHLPTHFKFSNGAGKWILKQILRRYLPASLFERPKMGFNIPLDDWLRGPLRDWADSLLDASRLKKEGYFHASPIRSKWEEHLDGKANWPNQIWNVLMFQSWLDEQHNPIIR